MHFCYWKHYIDTLDLGDRDTQHAARACPESCGDRCPDVNQISVYLQLICPCHWQSPLSACDVVAQGGRVIEWRKGAGGLDAHTVTLLQSFSVNVICPLIACSAGTE